MIPTHQKILNYFIKLLDNNELAHAYLFWGPEGVGKRAVADEIIKAVFCNPLQKQISKPCHKCSFCETIEKGIFPDFKILEPEKSQKGFLEIGINKTRELRRWFNLKPQEGGYKVVIIDKAQYLSREAANAFLKTLEEPKGKTLIIITTSDLEALPETIISRTQLIKFRSVPPEEIKEYLKKSTNLGFEDIKKITRLSFGRPSLAFDLAQSPSKIRILEKKFEDFFKLFDQGTGERFQYINQILTKDEISPLFDYWRIWMRGMLFTKEGSSTDLEDPWTPRLKRISQKYSQKEILENINFLNFCEDIVRKKSFNARLALENFMLKL